MSAGVSESYSPQVFFRLTRRSWETRDHSGDIFCGYVGQLDKVTLGRSGRLAGLTEWGSVVGCALNFVSAPLCLEGRTPVRV